MRKLGGVRMRTVHGTHFRLLYAAAIALLAAALLCGCGAPHDEAVDAASHTPAPMPTLSPSPSSAVPTPTITPPVSQTPRPIPTLAPASAPDELFAVSFMFDRAVFAVYGQWSEKTGVKFFDLESTPYIAEGDTSGGAMVQASQVLRVLGYTIDGEDATGITAHTANKALAFTADAAAYKVDGTEQKLPEGVPPATWQEGCIWVSTLLLPLPETVGAGENMITFDAREENDNAGRLKATDTGSSIWGAYPK